MLGMGRGWEFRGTSPWPKKLQVTLYCVRMRSLMLLGMHRLKGRKGCVLSREFAEHRERRRAPAARRDDREYREYLREEQRRSRGAAAPVGRPRRMPVNFRDRTLGPPAGSFSRSRPYAFYRDLP